MKKLTSLVLALLLVLSVSAFAEETQIIYGELTKPGQSAEELVSAQVADNGAKDKPEYFDSFASMLLALRAGKIDVASAPECVSKYVCTRNSDLAYEKMRSTIYFSMALSDTETELLDVINAAIAKLREDGTIDALKESYIDNLATDAEPEPAELISTDGARTVRVVVTGDLPPLDYMTADGQAAGFNVALLAAIGKEAGLNFELVTADAGARGAMLSSGRADLIFWMRRNIVCNDDGSIRRIDDETPEGILITEPFVEYANTCMHIIQ